MGLDMYLQIRKSEYISHKEVESHPELIEPAIEAIRKAGEGFIEKETVYEVGYWRKANAIHAWFIDECADGVDECQRIYVPVEKLAELKEKIQKIFAESEPEARNKIAAEELPVREGFFFGTYEYDEWYYRDLERTLTIVDGVLDAMEKLKVKAEEDRWKYDYRVEYQASW